MLGVSGTVRRRVCACGVDAFEGRLQAREQFGELKFCRRFARHDDVVGAAAGKVSCQFSKGCAQPPADSVADDGVADLLRDRKTEARARGSAITRGQRIRPGFRPGCVRQERLDNGRARLALQHKCRRAGASATADTLKLCSCLERIYRARLGPAINFHGDLPAPRFLPSVPVAMSADSANGLRPRDACGP